TFWPNTLMRDRSVAAMISHTPRASHGTPRMRWTMAVTITPVGLLFMAFLLRIHVAKMDWSTGQSRQAAEHGVAKRKSLRAAPGAIRGVAERDHPDKGAISWSDQVDQGACCGLVQGCLFGVV